MPHTSCHYLSDTNLVLYMSYRIFPYCLFIMNQWIDHIRQICESRSFLIQRQPYGCLLWIDKPRAKDCCLLWNDEGKANIKPIYECRCNGRLQTKRSTRLPHTGLVVELEDLKIKTRLTNEKFVSVKGECEIWGIYECRCDERLQIQSGVKLENGGFRFGKKKAFRI